MIINDPGCNFLYRIRGVDTQKAFDSVEPVCTPTVLQNQGPWAGKRPKPPILDIFGLYPDRSLIL